MVETYFVNICKTSVSCNISGHHSDGRRFYRLGLQPRYKQIKLHGQKVMHMQSEYELACERVIQLSACRLLKENTKL